LGDSGGIEFVHDSSGYQSQDIQTARHMKPRRTEPKAKDHGTTDETDQTTKTLLLLLLGTRKFARALLRVTY
jgi:hypothetical protein